MAREKSRPGQVKNMNKNEPDTQRQKADWKTDGTGKQIQ